MAGVGTHRRGGCRTFAVVRWIAGGPHAKAVAQALRLAMMTAGPRRARRGRTEQCSLPASPDLGQSRDVAARRCRRRCVGHPPRKDGLDLGLGPPQEDGDGQRGPSPGVGEAEDHGTVLVPPRAVGGRRPLADGIPHVAQCQHLRGGEPLPQAHRFQGLSALGRRGPRPHPERVVRRLQGMPPPMVYGLASCIPPDATRHTHRTPGGNLPQPRHRYRTGGHCGEGRMSETASGGTIRRPVPCGTPTRFLPHLGALRGVIGPRGAGERTGRS